MTDKERLEYLKDKTKELLSLMDETGNAEVNAQSIYNDMQWLISKVENNRITEKVKVSREVANFIQAYEDNVASYPCWEDNLIYEHSQAWRNNFEDSKLEAKCMKDISPFQLSYILINGYEIELTHEEIILENYKRAERIVDTEEDDRDAPLINKGYMLGVEETLQALNIKIKWVNE